MKDHPVSSLQARDYSTFGAFAAKSGLVSGAIRSYPFRNKNQGSTR